MQEMKQRPSLEIRQTLGGIARLKANSEGFKKLRDAIDMILADNSEYTYRVRIDEGPEVWLSVDWKKEFEGEMNDPVG